MSLPDTDQVREFIHEALDQITLAQSELGTGDERADIDPRNDALWRIQDAKTNLRQALGYLEDFDDEIQDLDFA